MSRLRVAVVLLAFAVVLWLSREIPKEAPRKTHLIHGPAQGRVRLSVVRLKEIEADLVSKKLSLAEAARQAAPVWMIDEELSQMFIVTVGENLEHKAAHLMMEWVESHPDRQDFLNQYRQMTGFTYQNRVSYHK